MVILALRSPFLECRPLWVVLAFTAFLLNRSFEKQEEVVLTVLTILWKHNPQRNTELCLGHEKHFYEVAKNSF